MTLEYGERNEQVVALDMEAMIRKTCCVERYCSRGGRERQTDVVLTSAEGDKTNKVECIEELCHLKAVKTEYLIENCEMPCFVIKFDFFNFTFWTVYRTGIIENHCSHYCTRFVKHWRLGHNIFQIRHSVGGVKCSWFQLVTGLCWNDKL